ncbi:hypothetical protein NZK35_23180 [Stieleria sp. ICT_E10.1]|uniref:hypothetical protein n=1 Tax=Stieleria sedimenti TaxID=2976331 RepID=UPI00217F5B59|nr:hypothetical protein [Stieleria sedimenti]MCS7469566.1 hypothetical protein [Stieleria sedimenti]
MSWALLRFWAGVRKAVAGGDGCNNAKRAFFRGDRNLELDRASQGSFGQLLGAPIAVARLFGMEDGYQDSMASQKLNLQYLGSVLFKACDTGKVRVKVDQEREATANV